MRCYSTWVWEDSFLIVIRLSLCSWLVSIRELFLTEAVPGVWLLAWHWRAGLQLSAKPDAPSAALAKLLTLSVPQFLVIKWEY